MLRPPSTAARASTAGLRRLFSFLLPYVEDEHAALRVVHAVLRRRLAAALIPFDGLDLLRGERGDVEWRSRRAGVHQRPIDEHLGEARARNALSGFDLL